MNIKQITNRLFGFMLLLGTIVQAQSQIQLDLPNADFDDPSCSPIEYVNNIPNSSFCTGSCLGPNWNTAHGDAIDYINSSDGDHYVNLYSKNHGGEGIYYELGCDKRLLKGKKYRVRIKARTSVHIDRFYINITNSLYSKTEKCWGTGVKEDRAPQVPHQNIYSRFSPMDVGSCLTNMNDDKWDVVDVEFTANNDYKQIWIFALTSEKSSACFQLNDLEVYQICEETEHYENTSALPYLTKREKTVITGSNTRVLAGQNVNFRAGESITIGPGFSLESGANFSLDIENCSTNSADLGDELTITASALNSCEYRLNIKTCGSLKGPLTYEWSYGLPNVASPTVSPVVQTNYSVKVTDGEGKLYWGSISVDPINVSVSQSNEQCGTRVSVCNNYNLDYNWYYLDDLGAVYNYGTGSQALLSPTETTTYFVDVTDVLTGNSIKVPFNVDPNPGLLTVDEISNSCRTTLSVCNTSGLIYEWFYDVPNSNTDVSLGNNPYQDVNPVVATNYYVEITNPITGDTRRVYHTVNPRALSIVVDQNTCDVNNTLTANICDNTGDLSFSWTGSDGFTGSNNQITVSPYSDVTYTLEVTDEVTGATVSAVQDIKLNAYKGPLEVDFVPNALIAGCNCANELWFPSTTSGSHPDYAFNANQYKLQVFNRYGSLVYTKIETRTIPGFQEEEVSWDGQSNQGSSPGYLPSGVYFYILEMWNCDSYYDRSGNITLLYSSSNKKEEDLRFSSHEPVKKEVEEEVAVEELFSFETYPNPFSRDVNVSLGFVPDEHTVVRVFDLKGSLMYSNSNVSDPILVITSDYLKSPGLYFVEVENNNDVVRQKIIKQ